VVWVRAAYLIGIFTIIGFELVTTCQEEAVNARLTVPKAVILSGSRPWRSLVVLVGFTMALPDVKSPDPIGTVAFWFGTFWTKVFLVLVITSIFTLTVVVTGGAARLAARIGVRGRLRARCGVPRPARLSAGGLLRWS
jgi:amino acid transporter